MNLSDLQPRSGRRAPAAGSGADSRVGLWPRARRAAALFCVLLLIGAIAAWLALLVTPAQSVSAAGQTLKVGAASPHLSLAGSGELDLFGQSVPTTLQFSGLIRPKLVLTHITIDSQLTQFVQTSADHGGAGAQNRLAASLVGGWERYFLWQTLVTAGFAVLLLLAFSGLRHYTHRRMFKVVAIGTLVAVAANIGAVALFAAGTPGTLRQVKSLSDLVGDSAAGPTAPAPVGVSLPGVQAVVIGDSTAAAIGNPPVAHPSAQDTACGRSADSYAADLAQVNGWKVLNLACSGATVTAGILGPQDTGGVTVPPQFGVLEQAPHASVVVVSIGANDLRWVATAALCVMAAACDDQASTAYFQSNLNDFARGFYDMLHDLAGLPQHPKVLINTYFDPFGPDVKCLVGDGFTPAKTKVLSARLATLNTVLADGAQTFGFTTVRPSFAGHELCSSQPYVQGLKAAAPFHPTAAGELTIALADQQALSTDALSVSAAGAK
ncbi:SGNH/GDSL hydrolase family protein [Actinocrinis puniceicyclus]|uniref:SGNH/GDSL hydrolase family protein n=1 Tax=Actinocrinis puniceicyclus TaxID=977794 RepID=A0A8J7WII6_9ACTN|nr:GDSL-type esterase/lipase family protein [Actinocrinis puniceicyclus]MBS2962893.1 SGNH/GDSL hydrolase family protein [Actinocrinis puniceicyclus]